MQYVEQIHHHKAKLEQIEALLACPGWTEFLKPHIRQTQNHLTDKVMSDHHYAPAERDSYRWMCIALDRLLKHVENEIGIHCRALVSLGEPVADKYARHVAPSLMHTQDHLKPDAAALVQGTQGLHQVFNGLLEKHGLKAPTPPG